MPQPQEPSGPQGLDPTSTGPWLLDDVLDQPVDPLIQCQAPKEGNLLGRRVVSLAPEMAASTQHPSPMVNTLALAKMFYMPQEKWRGQGDSMMVMKSTFNA